MRKRLRYSTVAILALLTGCNPTVKPHPSQIDGVSNAQQPSPPTHVRTINPPKHVVIVVEENHSYSEIAKSTDAPYINSLMREGASFTDYHGVEHPSQPNYLDLFSGLNQGVTSDACPHTFSAPNLASELLSAHLTFGGYSEDLPSVGYTGCSNGHFGGSWGATYARKHSPWVNFTNVPAVDNMPFTSFPKDFSKLPTVAFVIPNLKDDMHSGSIKAADTWLRQNIQSYAKWAKTHDSLLIVTWDEDDNSTSNNIPTVAVGQMVRPGAYDERVNHFNLLRTIEDMYGIPYLGRSKTATPINMIWR